MPIWQLDCDKQGEECFGEQSKNTDYERCNHHQNKLVRPASSSVGESPATSWTLQVLDCRDLTTVLIAEELPLQHFFGARVIGTLHEASVWLCGFTIGAAHRLPIESTMNHP